MKVITTCHKAGFEQYGHRWLESAKHWPGGLVMYHEGQEGFGYEAAKCLKDHPAFPSVPVTGKRCEDLPRLVAFKEANKAYKAPSWRYDIVRFSNKVFAAYDAFYDYDGIGVWLDADAVTYKPIPEGYVEQQLGGDFFAHFKRADWYTETGLWIMDCRHPETKAFLDTWVEWFESGAFKQLHEWHDCTTLDATLKLFLKDGRITTKSLSGDFERHMHPMAKADFAKYVDHCKGPRKADGFSPENTYR
jgi:hypothetical protein